MSRSYQPFIIRVGDLQATGFPVQAEFQGGSWSATIPASLPLLTAEEVRQALGWLERGFIDREFAQEFGARLFETLLPGPIREGFRTAYEHVAPEAGLRIVLSLPQQLEGLPWELIYDREGEHGFLARSATAPLVRHYRNLPVSRNPPEEGPLRILIVTASPAGYPPISSEEEVAKIVKSLSRQGMSLPEGLRLLGQHLRHSPSLPEFLGRVRQRALFETRVLSHATRQGLQQEIVEARSQGRPYHVVHFVGHGQTDRSGSFLLFELKRGGADGAPGSAEADLVPADDFAEMLAEPTISLVVLNACQTASASSFFRSVAQATLRRRVPAVIGMQVPILDRAAVEFAQEFYGNWAAGQEIESSLAYARRLISQEAPGAAADWSIPVLFMGPTEGLAVTKPKPRVPPLLRFLRWAIGVLLFLLSTTGLLLTIPDINEQLRTEAPVVRCLFPYPMDSGYRFNVVVTEFTVLDERGRAAGSKDGRALADYLYQQLDFRFDELDLGIPHDIRPPAHTCRLDGRTREEREQAAERLAERINADIVVYGVLTDMGERSQFSPEFYVNYRGFQEGAEITGQHEMGAAMRVALPFDPAGFSPADNPALSARTGALSLMTIGLAYYSVDDFEHALDYFARAETTPGWLETAGKEVIYLLLGNATVRKAAEDDTTETLDTAAAYFEKALSINQAYARARVGQAGVLYLMGIGDPHGEPLEAIDVTKLDESAAYYEAALKLGDPPASANIETKVHFGLGQVNVGRFVHALVTEGDWQTPLDRARAEFSEVVQEYERGNVQVASLASLAHQRLGLLARMLGRTEEAIASYRQAIELATPYYQAYCYTRIGEIHAGEGEIQSAIEAYAEAVRIAEFYGDPQRAGEYTLRLKELEEIGE